MSLKLLPSTFFFPIPPNPHLSLPPPPLLSLPKPSKSPKPLSSSSSSSSPIFLPHLEQFQSQEDQEEDIDIQLPDPSQEEEEEDEEEDDPIRAFFKSRPQLPDPSQEGRTSLQRNRRTTWHLAKTHPTNSTQTDTDIQETHHRATTSVEEEEEEEEGNVVTQILKLSKAVPENSTLGEFLVPFEGKVSEEEYVELLGRLGEEGSIRGCLYFFEWMGMQEPSLVTPRACSVLFPALGRAGRGEEVRVLFENLPRTKEFRDVRVYNAAVSALSCCGR